MFYLNFDDDFNSTIASKSTSEIECASESTSENASACKIGSDTMHDVIACKSI